ncbi:23S rRNA (guanosine(2251)-2'-O)-methyltransferase RlmB [Candidatus Magnetominusculus xianensis]|uniref:RNA methyltransferase n=1 Tax=Candidatus Magnetominusculus xianensis TaxID=1748249 RepID=A0ABR5SJB3_9BACT|nr:23S rRNA (guanosine(2251)-2'-O)-methyltransferase RlmB [Candidatus Magnetominusculus xianensis]KWT94370.1 RNA methyltransferase [Candidatus Magnetominusculus xianensis]MBF0403980.1 23S rRNA (guanosine(2251)-2'-O)-methyltransferase RlmB [Nitrospirota bacterium]
MPDSKKHGDDGNWIYGINPVMEALLSEKTCVSLVCIGKTCKIMEKLTAEAALKSVPVKIVDKNYFGRFGNVTHQGVCALIERRNLLTFGELIDSAPSKPVFVILDEIEDPGNFGAILRTAECAGVNGVIFQSRRNAGITGVVEKTSCGAAGYVPLCVVSNIKNAIRSLKEQGILICGADSDTGVPLWEAGITGSAAFVLGSEGRGLRRTVRELCDTAVKIPLYGKIKSLNVSVAAGILLFEHKRQAYHVTA